MNRQQFRIPMPASNMTANMMSQPMYAPITNAMQQPISRPVQLPPMQFNPYMQELMKGYSPMPAPVMAPQPDDFSRPILREMPQETPLSPYMQQLLQNYRVQNILAARNQGAMGMSQ